MPSLNNSRMISHRFRYLTGTGFKLLYTTKLRLSVLLRLMTDIYGYTALYKSDGNKPLTLEESNILEANTSASEK